jgi:signal transduction histidine kinase
MKPYSITRRLVIAVLFVQLISAVSITCLAVLYERHTHLGSFDIMLRGRADSLLGDVQDAEDPGDNVMLDGTQVNLPPEDLYEVSDASGRLLGRSGNWSGPTEAQRNVREGTFFRFHLRGRHYRVLKIRGLRMVDPGDKGGGIPRYVTVFYGSSIGRLWNEIWATVAFYALTSLALLAISGLLMFWLLNRGLAPLRELAAEATGVSVGSWNFAPSERVRMTKELAPLSRALETVLQGLERAFMQQSQFVSDAAHELKTAVAVAKSSVQLLIMKRRTVPEYEAGLERAYLDCERMEEIVSRMLTLARVEQPTEAGTTGVATDLAETTRLAAQQFDTMASVKGVQLIVAVPEAVFVGVNQEDLRVACSNLILNALQHSPTGSQVRVTVRRQETTAEFCVEDNGEGIPSEALPYVFDRFYRNDQSRSRNTGGTGLGLAICKAIVSGHGGTIDITSTLDVGTKVTFRLPLVS